MLVLFLALLALAIAATSTLAFLYFHKRGKWSDTVELRNALTGEYIGLTKAQYKRYVLAMGTKDPKQIFVACKEVQERARRLNLEGARAMVPVYAGRAKPLTSDERELRHFMGEPHGSAA